MKAREFKPRRLDVRAFIESGETLDGEESMAGFERLAGCLHESAEAAHQPAVHWHAEPELLPRRGAEPELWLHLAGSAEPDLPCQRCLEPVATPLSFKRSFLFVASEAQAAELDADSEDDVLALSRTFDLLELVEDELLMALPPVARHETCPVEVQLDRGEALPDGQPASPAPAGDIAAEESGGGRPNPFAVLARLRRDQDADGSDSTD
ncbi:MAG: hypothetical protein RL654_563 [Pseudomonadota bacterium]|jgi:uncharacterized protein